MKARQVNPGYLASTAHRSASPSHRIEGTHDAMAFGQEVTVYGINGTLLEERRRLGKRGERPPYRHQVEAPHGRCPPPGGRTVEEGCGYIRTYMLYTRPVIPNRKVACV